MADAPDFSGLPGWLQAVVSAMVIGVGAIFTIRGYLVRPPVVPPPTNQMTAQVIGGALADRYAMTDFAGAVRGLTEAVQSGRVVEAIDHNTEELERIRKAMERLVDVQARAVKD